MAKTTEFDKGEFSAASGAPASVGAHRARRRKTAAAAIQAKIQVLISLHREQDQLIIFAPSERGASVRERPAIVIDLLNTLHEYYLFP